MSGKEGKLRFVLMFIVVLLAIISLMMVYSSSFIIGIRRFGNGNYFIIRQVVSYAIGIILMFVFSKIDYTTYKKFRGLIYTIGIVLLVIVLIPGIGTKVNGARRWIKVGFLSIQCAELAKIMFILSFAAFLDKYRSRRMENMEILLPSIVLIAIYSVLIVMEKDLGTATHLFLIALVMLFLSNINMKNIVFPIGIVSIGASWLIFSSQNRMKRVMAYLEGWRMEGIGGGYQVRQSVIGIGNGGLTGLGYSNGRQKYFYLPELHTDFIFSVISEELGLIGATGIMLIYLTILIIGVKAVQRTEDYFGKYVAAGIIGCIVIQAMMNMLVVTGLMPAKGIPLPLISYGGSSVISMLIMIGILLNILKKGERK